MIALPLLLLLAVGVVALIAAVRSYREDREAEPTPVLAAAELPEPKTYFRPTVTADTVELGEEIKSAYAVVIDQETGHILGRKAAEEAISPASMTKILTLLVAVEQTPDLDDTFLMTREITDLCFLKECSAAGFETGEEVPVRDLLYGAILPSGADAALGLACYTAGTHEAFVARMNEKLGELGASRNARFTNCVGWYDDAHRCTVGDVAIILDAALRNDLCREVLSAHTYVTSASQEAPEGRELSNWFLRRVEDHMPPGVTIEGGKTGYVSQSGSCAASSAVDAAGRRLLCVTGNAPGTWACIYDHAALYEMFAN